MSEPPRLAVLIDAENMPAKYAGAIFDEISKFGEASVRRLYGDITEGAVAPWMEYVAPLAIAPFHQPKSTVGKNASDIALVIDAMDLLSLDRLDGFVIISSDSDFTKLAQRIREQGIDVWGMGEEKTPEAFRQACKRFITVENLQTPTMQESGDQPEIKSINHAFQLITNVITDTSDPDGWAGLAWVGKRLVQRYPDFDPRSYGHKKLSELVRATGKFEERGQGPELSIRPMQSPGK